MPLSLTAAEMDLLLPLAAPIAYARWREFGPSTLVIFSPRMIISSGRSTSTSARATLISPVGPVWIS
jgi:hypothetical protein